VDGLIVFMCYYESTYSLTHSLLSLPGSFWSQAVPPFSYTHSCVCDHLHAGVTSVWCLCREQCVSWYEAVNWNWPSA